ncbi:hypothetical protein AB0N09_05140 [Streptomyces erythrochromogenes]|uniref:hypothetical protein n=1 Tax=Streptomyces erythrochromogenes TaxID=285574 RepID=UPI00341A049C
MLYLLTDDARRALVSLPVPAEGMATIAVERADQPGLLLAGIDLHADGTVNVGHWPDGEDWERVLTTHGVPNAYGTSTPAQPSPVPLLDPEDAALITRLLQAAIDQRPLPDDQHQQAAQLLYRLTPSLTAD